jgi:hypothetical protein
MDAMKEVCRRMERLWTGTTCGIQTRRLTRYLAVDRLVTLADPFGWLQRFVVEDEWLS